MTRNSPEFRARASSIQAEMHFFTGTENYYCYSAASNLTYTDGVKWLAGKCGAYWLIDAINSHYLAAVRAIGPDFQLWSLTVNEDNSAVLECREDTNEPAVVRQEIEYTDFPLPCIAIYAENGVLLLPSEH